MMNPVQYRLSGTKTRHNALAGFAAAAALALITLLPGCDVSVNDNDKDKNKDNDIVIDRDSKLILAKDYAWEHEKDSVTKTLVFNSDASVIRTAITGNNAVSDTTVWFTIKSNASLYIFEKNGDITHNAYQILADGDALMLTTDKLVSSVYTKKRL